MDRWFANGGGSYYRPEFSWASAGDAPLLIGQRVLVKFMKPGETAGAKREAATGVGPDRAMVRPQ